MPEGEDLLLRADELVQGKADRTQHILESVMAIHEDVGEKDDSGRVGVVEPHPQPVFVRHRAISLRRRGVIQEPWSSRSQEARRAPSPWTPRRRRRTASLKRGPPGRRGSSTGSGAATPICASRSPTAATGGASTACPKRP